jgi:hypothetical protein
MGSKTRGAAVGLMALALAVGFAASAAIARSGDRADRATAAFPGSASRVVQARARQGDELIAGPVVVDHQAMWVEDGRRSLLVRSLDAGGRVHTIFSTSATPGAPKGTPWPFDVEAGIAAGGGRVAFVVQVAKCASSPDRPVCRASNTSPLGSPVDSVILFAGRPGRIRPVETVILPPYDSRRCGPIEPATVNVTDGGLVVDEGSENPACARPVSRLALRSFSGRLDRVLARPLVGKSSQTDVGAAAGRWVALVTQPALISSPEQLKIISAASGQTVLRQSFDFPAHGIDAVALDPSGTFAVMTAASAQRPCQTNDYFDELSVGQIGSPGLQILSTSADGAGLPAMPAVAIAGKQVAYGQATGRCLTSGQVAIASPGAAPTLLPLAYGRLSAGPHGDATAPYGSLAFDGKLVAMSHGNTVNLTTLPG